MINKRSGINPKLKSDRQLLSNLYFLISGKPITHSAVYSGNGNDYTGHRAVDSLYVPLGSMYDSLMVLDAQHHPWFEIDL